MADPCIVVHSLDHARAALAAAAAAGGGVILLSAPGAAAYAGAGWFREVVARARDEFPDVPMTAILDCGDAVGIALGALRAGVAAISLTAPDPVRKKVVAIARQHGARLIERPTGPCLDLADHADALAASQRWVRNQEL